MAATRRREAIREEVQTKGYVSLGSLSEKFDVAPVTIHRDLSLLESEGLVERVRGGARLATDHSLVRTEFEARERHMAEEKAAIAERAISEIPDGSTIFIDSSSSTLALLPHLEREPGRGLTIVTNSPVFTSRLDAPLIHVVQPPGELNQSLRAVTGRWTVEFIEQLSFNVTFISAAGVTAEGGLMTTQRELVEIARAAIARSERTIGLVDSSKFAVSAMLSIVEASALDLLITDDGLDAEVARQLESSNVSFIKTGGTEDNETGKDADCSTDCDPGYEG